MVRIVRIVLMKLFEDGDHGRRNARWHPNNCGLVHGGMLT
jgi:hypothetical protein